MARSVKGRGPRGRAPAPTPLNLVGLMIIQPEVTYQGTSSQVTL